MSSFATVGNALVTKIAARPNLAAITVRYGAPRFAEDLTSDAERSAIWLEGPGEGTKAYLYLKSGSKPTDETYTLIVAVQVERGFEHDSGPATGQYNADTRAAELLTEVEAAVAADVTLGLTSPKPLVAAVTSWQRADPPAQTEGYFCRLNVEVTVEARIAAP